MGEGGVIQADRDAAADYFELIGETNRAIVTRRGQYDLSACVQSHARHRQAAEEAIIRVADIWLAMQYGMRPLSVDLAAIRSQGHE